MRKDLIGIDIGTNLIKIITYDKFITVDTPENSFGKDGFLAFTGIGDLIKETIKANNIKQKKIALVLPEMSAYIKRFTMPYMTTKQLKTNLPYEFKDIVEKNKEVFLYDYCFIKEENGEMEIIAGVVEKHIIEKYKEMFKNIGLKLVKATTRTMAINDLLRNLDINNDIAFLGFGYSKSTIDIYKNGFYHASRVIELGVKDMIKIVSEILFCDEHIAHKYLIDNKDDIQNNKKMKELYETISSEIVRSINFYNYETKENTLENIYYHGGACEFIPFIETIKKDNPLNVLSTEELFNSPSDAYVKGFEALGAIYE